MTISFYDITIPVLTRGLKNTLAMVQKTQTWCKDNGKPETEILHARLAPDMNDFAFQIRASCVLAGNSVLTDSWRWTPPSTTPLDDETSLAGLVAGLQKQIAALEAIKREDIDGREGVARGLWTGGEQGTGYEFKFDDSMRYINQFGMPNFWFHNTTAYALCRMKGVPLGKFDFLAGGSPFE